MRDIPIEDLEASREDFEATIPRIEMYPCGCVGQYAPEFGWRQFVNPDCQFDNRFHGPKIKGYEYKSWAERPQNVKIFCEAKLREGRHAY